MSNVEFSQRMSNEAADAERMGNTELVTLLREVILDSLREDAE